MIELNAEALAKYSAAKSTASKETGKESLVLVYAPPSAGKTTLLLTASSYFSGLPNQGERIFCKDLGIIQTDPAGTEGYKSIGYDCELLNFRDILHGNEERGIPEIPGRRPRDAMLMAIALAATYQEVRYWGMDTITVFNDLERQWLVEHPELYTSAKSGNTDTMKFWDLLAGAHKDVYNAYMALPGVKLVAAHAKIDAADLMVRDSDRDGKEMLARKEKIVQPGNPAVFPDLTGRAKDYWVRAASLQIFIKVRDEPGKGLTRTLETEYSSTTDAGVKNRFTFLIGKNPPFNLRKILEQIRK